MAIYSLQVKPASRGAGQNAVAMAAYRSGGRLFDQRTQEFKDYSRKTGITHTAIFYPQGVDFTRQELWNMAEIAEKRKDARIAREILIALPHELPPKVRQELAENFAKELVNKYQIAVDLSLHTPDQQGDKRNFHAHLLLTTRQITEHGFTDKADLEREDKFLRQHGKKNGREQIEELRQDWENHCNIALERQGREERISAKSYVKRKLLIVPTIHIGKAATSLERKGIQTELGNKNRAIKHHNHLLYLKWKRWRANKEIQELNQEILEIQKEPELIIQPQPREAAIEPQNNIKRYEVERTAQEQQKPIQRSNTEADRQVENRTISGQQPARSQQTRETWERSVYTPKPERPTLEQQTSIQRDEDQQIVQEQPVKSNIASLLENAKSKARELENEQGQKLSINDLLKKSNYKKRDGVNREKGGMER